MFLIFAACGFGAGWIVNILSDLLPRYAMTAKKLETPQYRPATWSLIKSEQFHWLRLHFGVEWLMTVLFALIGWRLSGSADAFLLCGVMAFFVLIAVIDMKYRLVLNTVVYPAMLITFVGHMLVAPDAALNIVIGGVFAFSIFYTVAYLKPGDLGGGDVKLAALIGLTFGFPSMLWALIVGGTAGAVAVIYLVTSKSSTMRGYMPYAPFLCAGAMVALLYNPFTIG